RAAPGGAVARAALDDEDHARRQHVTARAQIVETVFASTGRRARVEQANLARVRAAALRGERGAGGRADAIGVFVLVAGSTRAAVRARVARHALALEPGRARPAHLDALAVARAPVAVVVVAVVADLTRLKLA